LLCICRAFFFFSCRRRHTRFSRDWSSDVCSSDLGDSTAAIAPEIPRNPRIIAWDAGLAADSVGQLIGGAYQVIENADTLYISVRTQYVAAGTPISIVMRDSRGTTIDSAATTSGTPDADAMSRVLVTLPAAATAAPGQYQIEAILDGVSQGMRPMAIGTN